MPMDALQPRSRSSIPANTHKHCRCSKSCVPATRTILFSWNTWPAPTSRWAAPRPQSQSTRSWPSSSKSRRLSARAIEALREVLRLRPDADDQRLQLARLLEEAGSPADTAAEYLDLARRFQAQSRIEEATTFAETALKFDPNSREAKELIGTLHETLSSAAHIAVTNASPSGESTPVFAPPGADRRATLAAIRDRTDHHAGSEASGGRRLRGRDRASMSARSTWAWSAAMYSTAWGCCTRKRGDHQRARRGAGPRGERS